MSITDPAVATAVINEAKSHNVYPGEMPGTDPEKIAQANELLRLAEQAKGAGVAGDAVLAVLAAAGQADPGNPFGAGAPPAAAAPPVPPAAAPPVPAPAAPPAPPVPAPAPPVTPPAPPAPPAQVEIKDAAGTVYMVDADQVAQYVGAGYTVVEGPIAGEVTPPVAPAQPAAPTGPVDPSQYKDVAPWDTYDKDKIPEIVSRIENLVQTGGDAAKPVLAHVWEYESNKKNRSRLMGKLQEIASGGAPAPAPAAPAPPAAPPAAPVAEGTDVQPAPPFQQAPPVAPPVPAQVPIPTPPTVPTPAPVSSGAIVPPLDDKATTFAQAQIVSEHLPIPADAFANQPAPQVPASFEQLGDVEISEYQAKFNACFARAAWLLAVAEGHSADAKITADGMVTAYVAQNGVPKGSTVTAVEAQATQAPEVQHARRIQHEWSEMARQLRALSTIYEKTCDRLSREQTRRDTSRQS